MRVALLEMAGYMAARVAWVTQVRLVIVEHGRIESQTAHDVSGFTPAGLEQLLGTLAPDVLVCGGIPPEWERALRTQGVEVIWGVIGTNSQVLMALASGQLCHDNVGWSRRDDAASVA